MKIFTNVNEVLFEPTSHGAGVKKVLIASAETSTALTQLAYGKLIPGESIPEHSHESMEEVFYFLHGEGIYTVDQKDLSVTPSTVVRIPAGMPHSLISKGVSALEFLYFGISTK